MPIELRGYHPLIFAAAYSVISATTILFGLTEMLLVITAQNSEKYQAELDQAFRLRHKVFVERAGRIYGAKMVAKLTASTTSMPSICSLLSRSALSVGWTSSWRPTIC
jgi:hypothetical protein